MKNILLVGMGFMGRMHAQVYDQLPNACLVGVVEKDGKKARHSLAQLNLDIPVYENLTPALDSLTLDAVDVCLPTDLHPSLTLTAFQAGKHVFCEKPIALTQNKAALMVETAEQHRAIFQVGHCIRFWPEYQALATFIKSGKAGKLLSLNLVRRSGRPNHSAEDWILDSKRSNGALMDLHIHDTDFVHHLFGKPQAVTSFGTRDSHGWSHVFTRYHFPHHCTVTAEGGWNYPTGWGFEMSFQAIFERGVVDFHSNQTPSLRWTPENGKPQPLAFQAPQAGKSSVGGGNISSLGGYFNELKYFVGCLESGTQPKIASGRQALESVETVLAEMKSAKTQKTISL